jgi:hypothetical protein
MNVVILIVLAIFAIASVAWANEGFAFLGPTEGVAEVKGQPSGTGKNYHTGLVDCGLGAGSAYAPGVNSSVLLIRRVPNAVALATGLTVEWCVADDPLGTGAVSKNSYWGITVTPITSGTTLFDESGLASSTEDVKATTMAAGLGKLTVDSKTVANADMNSLAAGNWALIRFRRLGANALDTDLNRVLLFGVDFRNT